MIPIGCAIGDRQAVRGMILWAQRGAPVDRWKPRIEMTKREQLIMKRLGRVRALFAFLREKRHVIFDDAFQDQLEEMYRQTGAGDEPHAPSFLCMVVLLQQGPGVGGASRGKAAVETASERRCLTV